MWAYKHLGGVCAECGSKNDLQFHHRDPSTKSFDIGKKMLSMSWQNLKVELDKCFLMCKECHKAHHATAKGTHGTLSSYRYCKCSVCKQVKSEYNRAYKQKRRASVV